MNMERLIYRRDFIFDPPKEIMDALAKAAYAGPHQYSVTFGAENFREALARKQGKAIGRTIDPKRRSW